MNPGKHGKSDKTKAVEYSRAYRSANPDAVKRSKQAWLLKNPGYAAKNAKEWRQQNPKKCQDGRKRYREQNKEIIQQRKKAYYKANKTAIIEKTKAADWAKKNPEKNVAKGHRRRALLIRVPSSLNGEDIKRLKLESPFCAYCLKEGGKLTIDHIIPIAKGGHNTLDNVVVACKSCNSAKRDHLYCDNAPLSILIVMSPHQ